MAVGSVWRGKTVNGDEHGLQLVQTLQEGRGIRHPRPMATTMEVSSQVKHVGFLGLFDKSAAVVDQYLGEPVPADEVGG